ncbi:MAG: FAD-dependent oxidoreductase [cyanobacterium endosymbiont of Rhopalodia musculus]|uniref:FAD-dependent oxidoreductase n=1 Tax=cyanobacterium endosymbiont of Epithemia clementina EcSB TaxID=3034674 RepID=UPI00248045B0|nr:FAD-dependent oxidoreductase [cyanobacterium endosymbiont of Epithemia clementina EcSB]WGT68420.1 FAD-dependent oxidoreductase [cyanobacterium endosymbiont of Epithemia clementina EcSB]
MTEVKEINKRKWVTVGKKEIEADEIIIAMGNKPNIKGFNLEGVKVKFTFQTIKVNQKLQTTNTKIYACSSAIGGCKPSNIAKYKASFALKNRLFFLF